MLHKSLGINKNIPWPAGKNTIVGAGAVVTKSFEEGYVVIGGNPAKVIYTLDKFKCSNERKNT